MSKKQRKAPGVPLATAFRLEVLEGAELQRYAKVVSEEEPALISVLHEGSFVPGTMSWPAAFEAVEHCRHYLYSIGAAGQIRLNVRGSVDNCFHPDVLEAIRILRGRVVAFLSRLRVGELVACGHNRLGETVRIPSSWWRAETAWFDVGKETLMEARNASAINHPLLGRPRGDVLFSNVMVYQKGRSPKVVAGREPAGETWRYSNDGSTRNLRDTLRRAFEQNEIADPVDYFAPKKALQGKFADWFANRIGRKKNSVRRVLSALLNEATSERDMRNR